MIREIGVMIQQKVRKKRPVLMVMQEESET